MTCTPCQASREGPSHAFHSPACIHCGARKIQRIQRFNLPREVIVSRCRNALAAWVAHGHAESDIRRLAKSVELVREAKAGVNKK